ncbi:MAG: hypothetical protein U9P73_09690 [Candidatus Cloacimonadota bacterium]|nr:hypothetical protein [Candidatus Cloacimonadota bacterium]
MKNIVMVFIFCLIIHPILSVEIPDSTKVKTYNINLSYGNASGGSIGIGRIQHFEKSTKEITANFHYLMNSDYFVTGVYGQINSYKNKQRVGFFTLFRAGLDYTKGEKEPFVFVIGGPNPSDYDMQKFEGTFPNLVIGCGYSVQLSSNNRTLIYFDLGIQKTFANLNLSVTF